MSKKVNKKIVSSTDAKLEFLKSFGKTMTSKPEIVTDDISDLVPWKVPFNHLGLQKITGGLLGGKIMHIEGESQTGKSWLLYELIANCVRMGGYAYLADVENAFEPIYGKAAGIDFKRFQFMFDKKEKVIEEMHKNFSDFIKRTRDTMIKDINIPIVVGLDSTAPTRCAYQYKNDIAEKESGHGWEHRANAMYEMLDKITPILSDYGASLVTIGQLRKNNKAGLFEDPTKGMMPEIEYRTTQQLRGKRGTMDKDKEDKNLRHGMEVRWETYKNRFVKPKQVMKLKYDYEKGLQKYSGLFDLLVREKEIKADTKPDPKDGRKKVKGCYVLSDETKTFYPLSEARDMLEKFPHLLEPAYVKVHEEQDYEKSHDVDIDSNEIDEEIN